jgi:putative nucleotidyltransferase with HDIG domain
MTRSMARGAPLALGHRAPRAGYWHGMPMSTDSILIVDDDENSCESLGDILELHGFRVHTAQTGEAAESLVRSTPVNAVLLDLRLPDRSGLEVLRTVKEIAPETEVLMVSGFASLASAIEAMKYGAFGYVQKPVNIDEVLSGLKNALERQRMGRDLRQANVDIRERVQELELLLETTRVVSSGLELAELLNVLAQQMVDRLQVTLGHISVLDENQTHLRIRAIYPIREISWELNIGSRIDLTRAPTYQRVVQEREVLLLRSDDPTWPLEKEVSLIPAEKVGSALLVPMVAKERLVGVVTLVEVRHWDRSPFTQGKINLCKAMASGAAIAIQNALLFDDREKAHLATLVSLVSALDARERETRAHSVRVQEYTMTLAKTMGVPEGELKAIATGALLHDIGKIGIQDSILLKPGALTTAEWDVMRMHPAIGAEILESLGHIEKARQIVVAHHERWDGSGYPAGMAGSAIPLGARIFTVADTLDAMTSDRPYRSKLSFQAAQDEIALCSGTQFDPEVVNVFLGIPAELWQQIQCRAQNLRR